MQRQRVRSRLGAAGLAAVLCACGSSGGTQPSRAPSPSTVPLVTRSGPAASPSTSAPSGATAPPRTTVPPRTTAPPLPTGPPTTGAPAVVLTRGATSRPLVALTFDAGSDTGHTGDVLDLLRAAGVRATFGLTGTWARANPALARRIGAEGHLVVNHTDRHVSWTGRSTGTAPLTTAQRVAELATAEAALLATTGIAARPWFRPPYGDRDASVDRDAGAAGYRYELMWTVDSLGWRGVPAAEVTGRVLAAAVPGEIVLMHVGAASTDWQALPAILAGLHDRGYGFVRADGF